MKQTTLQLGSVSAPKSSVSKTIRSAGGARAKQMVGSRPS